MAVKDRRDAIAIQGLLEPARTEKGEDFRRLSDDSIPNRRVMEQHNALWRAQFG
jgi:hypothetical protein